MSEVDVSMLIEIDLFDTFFSPVTNINWAAVWQNDVWHKSACKSDVSLDFYVCRNCTQWHSFLLAEYLQSPNNGYECS